MKAKSVISVLAASISILGSQAHAAVNFHVSSDALASASWDTWSSGGSPSYPGFGAPITVGEQSLSQGAGEYTSSGGNFISSNVTTNIINDFTSPPGGLLGGGDTFYSHDGAYSWDVDVELDSAATHFRVSYALVNSSFGAASDFSIPAYSTSGASSVASGSYSSSVNDNIIFYNTFAVAGPPSGSFSAAFSDLVFGGPSFPGSFKSMDGIYVEAFNGTPNAVPEPQAFALISGLVAVLFLAVRRRVRG